MLGTALSVHVDEGSWLLAMQERCRDSQNCREVGGPGRIRA